ncbi:MAG: hypothetical protein R3C39_15100 [Dehalococcoidia bacterium]
MVQPGPTTPQTRDEQPGTMDRVQQSVGEMQDEAASRIAAAEARAREGGADRIDQAAERIDAAGDSLPGPLSDGATMASHGVERSAEYVRSHTSSDMVEDVESYVREHPVQGVAMAVAAGFVIGRVLK